MEIWAAPVTPGLGRRIRLANIPVPCLGVVPLPKMMAAELAVVVPAVSTVVKKSAGAIEIASNLSAGKLSTKFTAVTL